MVCTLWLNDCWPRLHKMVSGMVWNGQSTSSSMVIPTASYSWCQQHALPFFQLNHKRTDNLEPQGMVKPSNPLNQILSLDRTSHEAALALIQTNFKLVLTPHVRTGPKDSNLMFHPITPIEILAWLQTTQTTPITLGVTSHNTHMTLLTNLGQFWTCHIPCHTPGTSSTLELISPWSTAITASHRLLRFLEFSSTLELGYHQYWPQYYHLKFSPSSSSCSCPVITHQFSTE